MRIESPFYRLITRIASRRRQSSKGYISDPKDMLAFSTTELISLIISVSNALFASETIYFEE